MLIHGWSNSRHGVRRAPTHWAVTLVLPMDGTFTFLSDGHLPSAAHRFISLMLSWIVLMWAGSC